MSENTSSKSSRFEEWEAVKDCNSCSHYWNETCDGVKVGTEKQCRDFVATRRMDIPEQIKSLRESTRRLCIAGILNGICAILLILRPYILGWFE